MDVIPNKDVIPNEDEIPDGNVIPNGEVELDEEGSGSGDQSRQTKVAEAGNDYNDQWTPKSKLELNLEHPLICGDSYS